MNKIFFKLLMCFSILLFFQGCYNEDTPEQLWQYPGPRPEIKDGPSKAQKMCYNLYQKYGLHTYYTLSGDEALIAEVGITQVNPIISRNPHAIPMQAADEGTAEKFLKILTGFYDLLPYDLAIRGLHKRHILVKINPSSNNIVSDSDKEYWGNTFYEDMQSVVYYGYLKDNADESGDKFDTNLTDWKRGITYQFFRGLAVDFYKGFPLSSKFGAISKGLYYYENRTDVDVALKINAERKYVFYESIARKCGFVHPSGATSNSDAPDADWGSYVAWIINTPKAERDKDIAEYERVKLKYNMVINYFKSTYQIDLEDFAIKWQNITV